MASVARHTDPIKSVALILESPWCAKFRETHFDQCMAAIVRAFDEPKDEPFIYSSAFRPDRQSK